MKAKLSRILAIFLCTLFFGVVTPQLTACGGDEPKAGKGGKRKGGKKRRKKRKKKGKGRRLAAYDKVPDEYRHKFLETDFRPDITGMENRDPFRSYVLNSPTKRTDDVTFDVNEICTKDNSVAPTYSLRNLRLLGIVLRGTKSYALFRDTGGLGHIVHRGDCLGKEKARVESIGSGFVRLSVIPEAPPGAPAPAPQTRDIMLYPDEMSLEPEGGSDDD